MVLTPNKENGFYVLFGDLINLTSGFKFFYMQLLKISSSVRKFLKKDTYYSILQDRAQVIGSLFVKMLLSTISYLSNRTEFQ